MMGPAPAWWSRSNQAPFIARSGSELQIGNIAEPRLCATVNLERISHMFRKTLIAIAAAGTLALGIGASTAPAEAKVNVYIGVGTPGFYPGYHHHWHGGKYWHCHYKKVKVWSNKKHKWVWVTKKTYCHYWWN
jgi:hypothetical protein